MKATDYAKSIPFYMTAETSLALIEKGREMQAALTRKRAIKAARAQLHLEKRAEGRDRRINHTTSDMLAFEERRWRDRRFMMSAPVQLQPAHCDIVLP